VIDHDDYRDDYLAGILAQTKTIALVGASPSPDRDSHDVMRFLQRAGYRVIPVNPNGGESILGEKVYASLAEVPGPFELVDVFRKSNDAARVTDEAIAVAREKGIRAVWMQLGIRDDAAARRAEAAGLQTVMDRCTKVEHARLGRSRRAAG
jgi:predicted CoA-binding protein